MRTIKFRAWYKYDNPPLKFVQEKIVGEYCEMVMEKDRSYRHSIEIIMCDEDWILEQFTGLFDKNNKEIYEGDILEVNNAKFKIQWDEEGGFEYETLQDLPDGFTFYPKDIEVIGNIHDNKELLDE